MCHIQRSCGYSLRPTLTIEEIRAIVKVIRAVDDSIVITVDNCYGAGSFCEQLILMQGCTDGHACGAVAALLPLASGWHDQAACPIVGG